MYHPYVRPSTDEIVAKIYPRRNGERTKVYPSGASLKGTVVNEVFQVCVYVWPHFLDGGYRARDSGCPGGVRLGGTVDATMAPPSYLVHSLKVCISVGRPCCHRS